jgi:hypothetical protein
MDAVKVGPLNEGSETTEHLAARSKEWPDVYF